MSDVVAPAIWLIIFLAGLPHLSETVYAPSLPEIANALHTSHAMAEYTLTIYLLGFALGTLFWGRVSDSTGRRLSVLMGLLFYMAGCIGCYFSGNIHLLMVSRLLQAFGGSVGSVLSQAIFRDVFYGQKLSKAYALLGMSVAFFPALGPALGGLIADVYGWKTIFIFLMLCAIVLFFVLAKKLPETHLVGQYRTASMTTVIKKFLGDKKILSLGFIVAACNGIGFCYFAEGSFCLINVLGFSASQFGLSFLGVAVAAMFGGFSSRLLLNYYTSPDVLRIGVIVALGANFLFSVAIASHYYWFNFTPITLMFVFIAAQMANVYSKSLITTNALALALTEYRWCTGTASSLFGFYYYIFTSLFTFGMGLLHNNTLLPMPLYFLAISMTVIVVESFIYNRLKNSAV